MENGQKKYFDNMLVVGANSWMKKWSSKMDPENRICGMILQRLSVIIQIQ
ncbi:MAG: hypothetical protein R3A12_07850 [Ignavibacteria bacterium]